MPSSRASLLIATAILVVGATASLASHVEAQGVGTSSLSGTVCAQADDVAYIRAPDSPCEGRGIPNATVRLTQPGPLGAPVGGADRTATTDGKGRYSIGQLADGEYALEASRAHFDSAKETVAVAGATEHDVALAGQDVQQPGKVVDPKGRPVAGARVAACCVPGAESAEARTGADGAFTVATRAGWRSLSVFDAPGFEDAYESRLLDGTPVTVTLQPKPAPDAFLMGTVRDQDGNPLAGIRIDAYSYGPPYAMEGDAPASTATASPGGSGGASPGAAPSRPYYYGGGSNHTTTAADGTYRLGVHSGSVGVSVQQEGYAPRSETLDVAPGQTVAHDIRLLKYPPKDAHLTGRITDLATGNALRAVAITVRASEYGLVECSDNGLQPDYGVRPMPATMAAEDVAASPAVYPYPGNSGCAIRIDADGTFSGDVTPGHSVVDVYFQHYLTCSGATDADGSSTRTCGPDYFPWATTLRLASGENRLDIALEARPGPDATVSGYVLDGGDGGDGTEGAGGQAIPGAVVWFQNQDNGAYGQATTDQDGSFRVRLRSGYHTITAQVPSADGRPSGFLTWQGVLRVAPGENPFDVALARGEEAWGCCYLYERGAAPPPMAAAAGGPDAAQSSGSSGGKAAAGGGSATGSAGSAAAPASASEFQDLGGGLGPYDADARQDVLQSSGKSAPGLDLAALAAALGVAAAARRRRAVY